MFFPPGTEYFKIRREGFKLEQKTGGTMGIEVGFRWPVSHQGKGLPFFWSCHVSIARKWENFLIMIPTLSEKLGQGHLLRANKRPLRWICGGCRELETATCEINNSCSAGWQAVWTGWRPVWGCTPWISVGSTVCSYCLVFFKLQIWEAIKAVGRRGGPESSRRSPEEWSLSLREREGR